MIEGESIPQIEIKSGKMLRFWINFEKNQLNYKNEKRRPENSWKHFYVYFFWHNKTIIYLFFYTHLISETHH